MHAYVHYELLHLVVAHPSFWYDTNLLECDPTDFNIFYRSVGCILFKSVSYKKP